MAAPEPAPSPAAPATAPPRTTRMLFLGADELADGFRLIGFEAHPNPTPDAVDEILRALHTSGERAFVLVDDAVMRTGGAALARARREGGRIVVIAVPPLAQRPVQLQSEVADRLAALFGADKLTG